MKLFTLLFVLLFSTTCFADITADDLGEFNKLSEVQKAEVVKKIAEFKESTPGVGTVEGIKGSMREWSDIGAGIGMMLISTAKELGIAANEFAQTPLGQLAIVVGLMYMFGSQLMLILVWFVCWFIFLPAVWFSYKKHTFKETVERTATGGKNWLGFPIYNTKIDRKIIEMSDNMMGLHMLVAAVFFVTGVIAMANS